MDKIFSGKNLLFLVGMLLSVLMLGFLLRRKLKSRGMPHSRSLENSLSQQLGEQIAKEIIIKSEKRYFDLLDSTPKRRNATLQKHIATNILVGLALYQALQKFTGDQPLALQRTQDTLENAYLPKLQAPVRLLGSFPQPFRIFRWAVKARMRQDFPPEGWETEWVVDNAHEISFNLHSCLYVDVLRSHSAEELTPVFCHLDDVMMEDVNYISWQRTQTIARGGEYCDFRWVGMR